MTGEPVVTTADANALVAKLTGQANAIHLKHEVRIARLERLMIRLMPLMPTITIPPEWLELDDEDGLDDEHPQLEDRPLTDWPSTPPDPVR